MNQQNIQADFVQSVDQISRYKVVIFPHVAIADEKMAQAIEAYAEAGGVAILSARSGVKDQNAHYRPMKAPGVFKSLAGCEAEWFTAIPQSSSQGVQMDGKVYPVDTYLEMLAPMDGGVLASYSEGFCRGKPAIVKRDNVYYVGFYTHGGAEVYCDLVRKYVEVDAACQNGVEIIDLDGYRLYLNHGDVLAAVSGYDYITDTNFTQLEPFGVALIKK